MLDVMLSVNLKMHKLEINQELTFKKELLIFNQMKDYNKQRNQITKSTFLLIIQKDTTKVLTSKENQITLVMKEETQQRKWTQVQMINDKIKFIKHKSFIIIFLSVMKQSFSPNVYIRFKPNSKESIEFSNNTSIVVHGI